MKKNYFLLVLFVASCQLTFSQIITIPDANFKSALVNLTVADFNGDEILDGDVDTNNDGEIDAAEANAVLGLDVNFQFISSLDGIAAFSNLQSLNCNTNDLTVLDVSQNSNLTNLECRSNDLMTLDVSSLSNLNILDVNFNELTTITIGSNSNLERIFCAGNNLTSIDVSQTPNLKRLSASMNQIQTINVSNNTLLEDLFLQGNQLINIDLSSNANLDWLDINTNAIAWLDLSQNPLLETLSCAFNELTILNLTNNTNLVSVFCTNNLLTGLDIQNGTNTNITLFDASNNPNLTCINVDDAAYSQSQASWTEDATASYSTSCPPLSTEEFQTAPAVTLFPNPTTGILQFESTKVLSGATVYNLIGQQVKYISIQAGQKSIDISELKTGSYFVTLQSTTGNTDTKLIVKK